VQGGAPTWAAVALLLGAVAGSILVAPASAPPGDVAAPDLPPSEPAAARAPDLGFWSSYSGGALDQEGVQMWRVAPGSSDLLLQIGATPQTGQGADNGSDVWEAQVMPPTGNAVMVCKKVPCETTIVSPEPGLWHVVGLSTTPLHVAWVGGADDLADPLYGRTTSWGERATDQVYVPPHLPGMVFRADVEGAALPPGALPAAQLLQPDGSLWGTCLAPCLLPVDHPEGGVWQVKYLSGVALHASLSPEG